MSAICLFPEMTHFEVSCFKQDNTRDYQTMLVPGLFPVGVLFLFLSVNQMLIVKIQLSLVQIETFFIRDTQIKHGAIDALKNYS